MRCPYCSATDVKVLESRESPNEESTRRRRECENCEKRFTTYERVETIDISVVKKNGALEAFDRNKILKGIMTACQKRPVSREKIEESVSRIESTVRSMDTTEVKSTKIGDLVVK